MVIQRGWKILSDTGSTSASSTDANRSPMGGLNSSSDDSNCSNQTTHSMVTSVASPTNNTNKIESSSLNSTNSNMNTPSQQTETMKFVTTPQIAENTLQKLRQRFSNTTPLSSSSAESAMRSLELVRIAVQAAFDKEIDEMVKHFIETYFKPAFNNIKENLGQGAINEDALQKMSCALLENAKSQYKIQRFKPQISTNNSTITTIIPHLQDNTMRMALKRPAAPNKPTSTVIEMQKRFFPDNMIIKPTLGQQQQQTQQLQQQIPTQMLPSVATIKATLGQIQPTAFVQQSQQQLLQPKIQQHQPNVVIDTQQQQQQPRRHIFWNTGHMSISTKFVLDVQANQAFGFSTEGKERLANKHPQLIRYLADNADRDWLINQQIIPQTNNDSRFLFLFYDEVCRLYQTHDVYKTKATIDLSVMMPFTVPDFMIKKMIKFFLELNDKSKGVITDFHALARARARTATIQQHLQQQQQLSQQQSNSHLRNALLLGTQTSLLPASTTSISNVATTSDSSVASSSSTSLSTAAATPSPSSNISSTDNLLQQKTKSSNLSSSHATLTALLNNSSTCTTTTTSNSSNEKSNTASINSPANLSSSSTASLLNKLRK